MVWLIRCYYILRLDSISALYISYYNNMRNIHDIRILFLNSSFHCYLYPSCIMAHCNRLEKLMTQADRKARRAKRARALDRKYQFNRICASTWKWTKKIYEWVSSVIITMFVCFVAQFNDQLHLPFFWMGVIGLSLLIIVLILIYFFY